MIAATKRQKSPFRRKNEITVKIRFSEHSENRIFLNRRGFAAGFSAWLCGGLCGVALRPRFACFGRL